MPSPLATLVVTSLDAMETELSTGRVALVSVTATDHARTELTFTAPPGIYSIGDRLTITATEHQGRLV